MKHFRMNRRGFTLVELLVVLAVVAMLLLLAVPSLVGSSAATQLTTAGDLLLNRLSEAQQEAIASDSEIQVSFYKRTNPRGLESAPQVRSFRTFVLDSLHYEGAGKGDSADSTAETRLPEGIVISSKPKITSFFDSAPELEGGSGAGEPKLYLTFLPDGSTSLPPGNPWFLTLVSEESEATQGVPANFYTIQIDPVTGRIRSFRP